MVAEEQAAKARAAEAKRMAQAAADAAAAASAAAASAAAASAAAAPGPAARRDDWLLPGILVKVMDAAVGGGAYHKAKGAVVAVEGTYCAQLRMLGSGDVLRLDVADLETVLPREGSEVMLLFGQHRGATGLLAKIHASSFCADVQLHSGLLVQALDYSELSKTASST
jgi:hypothetical protein